MRFAAIADIHGNSWALEAVLADIDQQNIAEVINLGDVFSGPLNAARTAELLLARNYPTIRGNHDRYLIEQTPDSLPLSDKTAYDQLDGEAMAWLRTLPFSLQPFDGVYACHGTPKTDSKYWMQRVDPDGVVRHSTRAELEVELTEESRTADLILCAHTHIAGIASLASGALLLNPGSVGCPAYDDDQPFVHIMQSGTPMASYAVLEKGASGWSASLRWVPYAHQKAAACARAAGREDWAAGLATGWYHDRP